MSRVLPILFNTEMVRAILDGRKTVTRRVVKQSVWENFVCERGKVINFLDEKTDALESPIYKAPFQKGDILYVRESFCQNYFDEILAGYRGDGLRGNRNAYKADYRKEIVGDTVPEPKWTPCIHMPKEAARIWLNVTDVRVERLQDIKNFLAEGIELSEDCKECLAVCRECNSDETPIGCDNEIEKFSDLWDSIVKKADIDRYGWDANPWVWVIEFERCWKPELLENPEGSKG